MAVYLRDYLKQFANEKKLEWFDSRDNIVRKADKDLVADRSKLDEIWKSIEDEFHKDIVSSKINKWELEAIKKKIRQAL